MASDVDIILEVAVNGIQQVNNLSNAIKQLNRFTADAANPIKALDARSRALNQAVGANGVSLNKYAKTVSQLASNQTVLASEIKKVQKELNGLGKEYVFGTGASKKFQVAGIQGLKAYNTELKKIKVRALVEDIKSIAQESKRLGKDMQFVGRSLIIGLTTPITLGMRQALQGLVATDKEIVRLTKVLEGVAPTAEIAREKLGAIASEDQVAQLVQNYENLKGQLTDIGQKFGLARSLTIGLSADFAELGITSTDNIVKLTELTAVAEKLGNMEIGNAKELIQSLYFQAVRTISLTQPRLSALQREEKAIASARAQLNLFNQVENVTALTLRDLGDAFPEVAAAATSFGLSMTEASAMLAPMKAAGFEIGASANSIKVSLQRITAPTKQNSELLKRLSKEYGTHFNNIKGSGLDAIQSLVDAYNDVSKSAAGAEGAQEMFAKLFGVRQGPRMETAIQQLALFDSILKDTSTGSAKLAEKQIQNIANSIISASDATLPLIKQFTDIGILSRIATAAIAEGSKTARVEGFGEVTQQQIDAAKKVRIEIGNEMAKLTEQATREAAKTGGKAPADLISQIGTEAGRAMMIQLAGPYTAQQKADQELKRSLESLDVQLSIIKNNFRNFASELIESLRPAINQIIKISDKLYNTWKNLSPETKKLVSNIALIGLGVTAAIGPLVFILGQARLAFGTVTKALFGFLPGLKTLSIESLASRKAMLNLKNPLTVVGETIVNTNSKFATLIATIASSDGPMQKFAQRFGEASGILKKTTTAPVPLVAALDEVKGKKGIPIAGSGKDLIRRRGPLTRSAAEVEEAMQKRAVRDLGFGSLASRAGRTPSLQRGLMEKFLPGVITGSGFTTPTGPLSFGNLYQDLTKQMLTSMGFPATGGRGPGGRFSRPIADMLSEAETMQAAGVTSASAGVRGAGGRFRALTSSERTALKVLEDAQGLAQNIINDARNMANTVIGDAKTKAQARLAKSKELATKDIDFDPLTGKTKFKGREISDKRSTDIYRGGVKGMLARTAETGGRVRESVVARFPKPDLNPINAYKKSIASASAATATLRAQTLAATGEAPRKILAMRTAMIGFANGTALGTKALKLMKVALVSSGIGVILLSIGVAVMLVKNNMDKFSKAGKKGFDAIGRVVNILKTTFESLVRPIVDLFASFSDGEQGATGAASGIGTAFNGIAVAIEFVAKIVKWFVENIIQPYLYGIANVVKAVVSIFQGKWGDALKYLGAAVASVFGGIAKLMLTVIGFTVKQIINFFFEIPSALLKAFAFGIEQATNLFFGFVEWIVNQVRNIPFLGRFLGGVGDTVISGLKTVRDTYVGVVRGIANGVNAAGDWLKRGIDSGVNAAKKGIDTLANSGIKKSKGKLNLLDSKDKEKAEDDIQELGEVAEETMANSVGTGIADGAEEGAKEAAQRIKDLKKELQGEVLNRAKDAIQNVVEELTNSLKKQKEASLKIYDDQIDQINQIAKAEERLTAAKEYEQKRREILDLKELNSTNFRRQRMIAIYEGRIDDARQLSLEQKKSEQQSDKEVKELDASRNKELADQKREDLIDSINRAKEVAQQYFDEMIEKFKESAKKITEFPPTTAEEFNTQLQALKDQAVTTSKSMGAEFTKGITSVIPDLATKSQEPLKTALSDINTTITENNPFGENGTWQQIIDAATDYLIKKYQNLNSTMSMIFDESRKKFKQLSEVYQEYRDLMDKEEGKTTPSTTVPAPSTTTPSTTAPAPTTTTPSTTAPAPTTTVPKTTTAPGPTLKAQATGAFNKYFPNYRGPNASVIISHIEKIFGYHTSSPSRAGTTALSKFISINKDWSEGLKYFAYQTAVSALKDATVAAGGGGIKYKQYGGYVPGFSSTPIPAVLHGGEYVVSAKAVKNIGLVALQQMNAMRFSTPNAPKTSVGGSTYHEQVININVDTFIGERTWFENMMKDYNIAVAPQNQKNAGLQNRNISTYSGINRGM